MNAVVSLHEVHTRIRTNAKLEQVFVDPNSTHKEFLLSQRNGHQVSVELSGAPIRDLDAMSLGVVIVARDITERIETERMKSEFISTVSHELRTPLTSVIGSLGLIQMGAVGEIPDPAKELLEVIDRNSRHLLNLINDLLDIDKLELGNFEMVLSPTSLSRLLRRGVLQNESYGLDYSVKLVLKEPIDEATLLVDPERFDQIMNNLLSNAMKFSPTDGRVEVSTELGEASVRVSVRDWGEGIPDEFRPRMFTKFAQADGSATRKRGGTGLGLSIVKLLVERMNGTISYESTVGVGTVFHVDFPLYTPPAETDSIDA